MELIKVICKKAGENTTAVMPGYTHLQREMCIRDRVTHHGHEHGGVGKAQTVALGCIQLAVGRTVGAFVIGDQRCV